MIIPGSTRRRRGRCRLQRLSRPVHHGDRAPSDAGWRREEFPRWIFEIAPNDDAAAWRYPRSNLPRCAPVSQAAGERLDEAVYPLGRLEQDGAAIGTRLLLLGRDQGLLEQVREEDSL